MELVPNEQAAPEASTVPSATTILGSAVLTAEPEVDNAAVSPRTSLIPPYDLGFVPRGVRRTLRGDQWVEVNDPTRAPSDIYSDIGTFGDRRATVQVVTFYKKEAVRAKWEFPLKLPDDNNKLREVLKKKGDTTKTWRWIHCEGLHGSTLKTIAEETNWPLDVFSGIFTWTRPSAELVDGCLLVHFFDQATHVWMLYRQNVDNPVFITCTSLDPNPTLKTRWEDYVDHGDSRHKLLLRKDPSLMFYAMMRAIIQDLRATASQKHKDMYVAYDLAMSQPSKKSLRYFYELQQNLIQVKLDTTALRDACGRLIDVIAMMHKKENFLVSSDTQYMLKDQMGLVCLLFDELPENKNEAEAIATLAFNTLTFSNNNLLRLLAILTIASVPLTIVSGLLSLGFFDHLDGEIIAIIYGSVTAAVLLGLAIFLGWDYNKIWRQRYRAGITRRDDRLQGWDANRRVQEQRFIALEAQNHRMRAHQSKRDSLRPDIYQAATNIDDTNLTPYAGSTMFASFLRWN